MNPITWILILSKLSGFNIVKLKIKIVNNWLLGIDGQNPLDEKYRIAS